MGKPRRRRETKDEKTDVQTGAKQMVLLAQDRIHHYIDTFKGYLDKRNTLNGHYRQARKTCKAEGINPERIDEAIELMRGDPQAFRDKYEQTGQVLRAVGAPFQLQIFDSRFDNPVEQATAEGTAAGRAGAPMDCRYPEDSAAAKAYNDAYTRANVRMAPGAQELSDEDVERSIVQGRPIALEEARAR